MKEIRIDYSVFTDQGDRERNEDASFVKEQDGVSVFLVADGLGGHKGGKEAAEFAAKCVDDTVAEGEMLTVELLERCFTEAQEKLMKKRKEEDAGQGMKTTLTLLLTDRKKVAWGHIGDTRLYHFRKNRLIERTTDHTAAQMMVALGQLKEEEIAKSKERNRLTGVLGGEWATPMFQIDSKPVGIRRGDSFLICTDGFWETLDTKSAGAAIAAMPAQEALEKIKSDVFAEREKMADKERFDNATAILIKFDRVRIEKSPFEAADESE